MITKNQAPRHSLPPKPMVAPPPPPAPATTNDTHRSLTENCVAKRDCQMEWSSSQTSGPLWTGQAWSSTPPIPTPALTTSSLSSSSLYGERSPILGASGHSYPGRRTFDIPSMTSLPPAKSLDGAASVPLTDNREPLGVQSSPGVVPGPCNNCDASMASLSSSLGALSMSPQQVRGFTGSMDAASMRMGSPLTDPRQQTPLLIPLQPTGAGVPLTSVVETLSSRGSKAAAEDPETVAAAYKLSQWGIGIGPGINPKVAASRNGTHSRLRSTASEPPIVNTGNSGPMCVQAGDWICTGCGFVNWRRRNVCLRCYPESAGNDIGRGLQGGESLARRLADGLDTDTEEYRQSVQALCPDREKRGINTYMQRPAVHGLPRNPLQAYGGASSTQVSQAGFVQGGGSGGHANNLLGIHMSSTEQQQWRQQMKHPDPVLDQSATPGHCQQPSMQGQIYVQASSSSQQQQEQQSQQHQQQQQYFNHTHAANPYKSYTPQTIRPPMSTPSDSSPPPQTQERSQDNTPQVATNAAGRMSLFRSATFSGDSSAFKPASYQQHHQAISNGENGSRPPSNGWSSNPQQPHPGLPRDIWAPAPKQAALIPVDPEDVSREKRAKPEPIGTRSSRSGSGAASNSTIGGTPNILESAGRKDDKHANNAFVDYWTSDSLTNPPSVSVPASSASAGASAPVSVSLHGSTDAKCTS